jgi:hypothetical protein
LKEVYVMVYVILDWKILWHLHNSWWSILKLFCLFCTIGNCLLIPMLFKCLESASMDLNLFSYLSIVPEVPTTL